MSTTRNKRTAPNAAVLAAALATPAAEPKGDKLEHLRRRLVHSRDLELKLADQQEAVKKTADELTLLRTVELPGLYEELGIDTLGLPPEGNAPGYDADLVPFYSASIPKDAKRAGEAFELLKELGAGDLIKNQVSVPFGRGDAKKAEALEKFLTTKKIDYDKKVSVHSGSLTAEIRRRYEDGTPLSPTELSTLGGYAGTVVKLKQRKD